MLTLLVITLLSQTAAVRRTTPASDDPGMVVRQVGPLTVNGISPLTDGGIVGTVIQGPGLTDGGSWTVNCLNCSGGSGSFTGWQPDGGNIGYLRMPDGGPVEVYVVNPSGGGSGGGWVPDGGFVGFVAVVAADGGTTINVNAFLAFDGGYVTTNGLTDTQLRASAVPVSLTSTTVTGSVAVTGPLTDTQLRATPVPVSGTVTANAGSGTMAVSAASLPLPSGAATSALQTTGNTSVASIDTKTPALGQTTMAGSVPVTIASNQTAIPTTLTSTTITGTVAVSAASLPLPTGAATEATLAKLPIAPSTALGSNSGVMTEGSVTTAAPTYTTGNVNPLSLTTAGALRTDGSGVTQPVSGSVSITGTPAVTITSGTTTVTQATGTNLHTVTDTGSTTAVTGTVAVSGPLTDTQLRASAVPVSLTSTTLTGTSAVNESQINGVTPLMGNGVTGTGSQRVTIASDNTPFHTIIDTGSTTAVTGTVAVSAASLPLPTGAATETTLGTRLADSTFTGRFPAAGALADTTSNPTTTGSAVYMMGFNGTSWDRIRSSTSLGITVNISNTTLAVTQSGTWNVGLSAGTNYVGKVRLTDGTLDTTLLNSAPGSDTGQVSVPVRIISSLAGGAGGTSSSFGSAFPASGTSAGFSDGTNMQGARVFDADTGGGTQYVEGVSLRVSASGGSTEAAAGAGTTNASTLRVVLPTDQSSIPVTLASTTVTGSVAVTGPLTDTQLRASAVPVSGTVTANAGSGTMAVSLATLPALTAGAAVIGHVIADTGSTTAVTGTVAVSAAALPLPTGAATETTLAKLPITQGTALGTNTLTMVGGSVTTAAPTFVTGNINQLSLTTTGDLRTRDVVTGATGAAPPANAHAIGYSDGTNMQIPRVFDVDSSGGTAFATLSVLTGLNSGSPTPVNTVSVNGSLGLVTTPHRKVSLTPTSTSVTCATTATLAPASVASNRSTLTLFNNSTVTIYIGGSTVTTSTGVPLYPGASFTDDVEVSPYYCIVAAATAPLIALEN